MNIQISLQNALFPILLHTKYPHRLYRDYSYTDDVREEMLNEGTRWMVEHIFALQEQNALLKSASLQYWDFKTLDDGSLLISCRDGKGRELYFEQGHSDRAMCENTSFMLNRTILDIRK